MVVLYDTFGKLSFLFLFLFFSFCFLFLFFDEKEGVHIRGVENLDSIQYLAT